MSLITTIEEIKTYLVTDANFSPENVIPYISGAKTEIARILGTPQYNELLDYYESQSGGIDELDSLLPMVQKPLFYFAFLKGLDNFNVSIGNNGIAVVSTNSLVPASTARVEKLRESLTQQAYDSLEDLLLFLEENISDFPLWESSDAYAFQHHFLIYSARTFDDLYHIHRSRLTFIEWRPTMYNVELTQVVPQISNEFLQELKDQIDSDTVSVENTKVLPLIQRSIAYFTAGEYSDAKHAMTGNNFLVMAKRIMDAAPDDYPTYKASSVYNELTASYQPYENTTDSNLAYFG